jgi:hypothetical protein
MPFQEQLMYIIQSPYILLGIPIGLLFGVFGYRLFKLALFVTGFCFGMFLTLSITQAIHLESGVMIISIIAGILFGLISFFLYQLGIFFIGAFMGGTLGSLIGGTAAGGGHGVLYLILICAALGGVLALVLQKFLIVFATSFVGALFFTMGLLSAFTKTITVFHFILITVLTACFMVIQYVTRKKTQPEIRGRTLPPTD